MRSRAGKVHLKSSPAELVAAGLLLPQAELTGRIDLAAIFNNHLPVELEIGPGKGAFVLERASSRPEVNILAVEWAGPCAYYTADRVHRAGLRNVRVIHADATLVLPMLPPASIQRLHIYFPDPWPKYRHRHRRLIKAPFLETARRVLRVGGWLGLLTDHAGYYRQMRTALAAVGGLMRVPWDPISQGGGVRSNFLLKYARQGRRLHALAALRYR